MLRHDFVMKLIQQLGAALARIARLRNEARQAEALEEIAAAKSELPLVPGLLEQLSPSALVRTLGDDELIRQLAQLYRTEAELRYELGEPERAVRCLARSKDLLAALESPRSEE